MVATKPAQAGMAKGDTASITAMAAAAAAERFDTLLSPSRAM
jgi:hypothetical protein